MNIELTQRDIEDLKAQGYTNDEIRKALLEIEKEELTQSYNSAYQGKMKDPRINASQSTFQSIRNEDIVRWQLELNDILERAEHILKGDIVVFKDGQIFWQTNPNPKGNSLNNFGVQLIMKVLSTYITRNTILGNYKDEEVRYKVLDFGKKLNDLIFMKYEEMGMNTEDKRKEYPMLVGQMVDIVHSSYTRAKDGGERRSLREMISVGISQNYQNQAGGIPTGVSQQKTRGLLNPMRYVAGKYY